MMSFLRKHRTWLMTVIAVLSIPFIFYFVRTDPGAVRSDQFATLYKRKVSLVEAQRTARLLGLANALDMSSFVDDLTEGARNENERAVAFILNLIILRHEAARLGVRPATDEIVERVRNLAPFRGSNGFDMNKYSDFVQNVLSPNGQAEAQIEELVRDELALQRIKQLVATGVAVSESESKSDFEKGYSTLSVTVARLSLADFAKDVKPTDEEIGKYYESHKSELKSPEKRKVDFVSLTLSDDQKKLTGKERIDALQKLADRANDLSQALLEKGADFKQVAARFQLPVQTTGDFTAAEPDPQLKGDPKLGAAAFQLTAPEPVSDPVQMADGFYILHLAGVIASRPLTLEEAKPQIVDALKNTRAREALTAKGAQVVQQLRQALGAGQPLDAALKNAGVKAEKLPPFSLVDEAANPAEKKPEPQDTIMIKNAVADLQPGGVSDLFPSENGAAIAILEKRDPPAPAEYAQKKAEFEQRYLRNLRTIVFHEWLRDRQREAGLGEPQKG